MGCGTLSILFYFRQLFFSRGASNKFAANEKLCTIHLTFWAAAASFAGYDSWLLFDSSDPFHSICHPKDDFNGISSTIDQTWGSPGELGLYGGICIKFQQVGLGQRRGGSVQIFSTRMHFITNLLQLFFWSVDGLQPINIPLANWMLIYGFDCVQVSVNRNQRQEEIFK